MSSRRGISWSQLRIGVMVSTIASVLVTLVFFIDQVSDAIEARYTLYFDTFTTQTLSRRAPVWLAGQPVGVVAGMALTHPDSGTTGRLRIKLSISVDAQPHIRQGAVGQVTNSGLLGEAVINILPPADPGPPLPDGGELGEATELEPFKVTQRLRAVSDSFQPVAERWRTVLERARSGDGTLQRLVRRPTEIRELSRNFHQAAATFDTLAIAARGFDEILLDAEVRAALARIGPRLSELAYRWKQDGAAARFASSAEIVTHLEATAQRLDLLSERLESGRGTLGRLMNDDALSTEFARTRNMLRELRTALGREEGDG